MPIQSLKQRGYLDGWMLIRVSLNTTQDLGPFVAWYRAAGMTFNQLVAVL